MRVHAECFRLTEVEQLCGDPTKARTLLGWNPQKTSLQDLVKLMVKADAEYAARQALKHGP